MTEDFYDLLDVSRDASQDEIKSAFREKVRVYHPDRNDDDRARAQFTAVKKAYDILGDPVERRAYDRLGHEDYVAKRTKGLPSPDVWRSAAGADDDSSGSSVSSATTSSTTGTARSSTTGAGTSTSGRSDDRSSSASTAGSATSAAGGSTGGSRGGSSTASSHGGNTRSDGGATATARTGTASTRRTHRFDDHPLVRWWRRRNVAGPLLWVAALTYLGGLAHFAATNVEELRSAVDQVAATGAEPAALWAVLTESRHGVDTVEGFLANGALVAPPSGFGADQWYGLLAGIVVLAVLAAVGVRAGVRSDLTGPVSIEETVLVAAALGSSTLLAAGPLLSGIVLLPLLFGVVVHRTRGLPGWSPSYVYVVAVSTPAVALAASATGYRSLGSDLALFVVIPVIGALGLPIRVAIRKRFGV